MLLKKPNTLNYPILFWNIVKFFQIVFRYFKHLDRLLVEVEEKIILEISSLQVFKWQSVGGVNLSAIVYFIFATVGVSHLAVRVLGFKSIKNYIAEHNRNLFSKMSSIAFPGGFHLNPFAY